MSKLQISVSKNAATSLWLHKRWNRARAEYQYQLQEITNLNGYSMKVVGIGDEDWANATSEHYGLKIIDGPEI